MVLTINQEVEYPATACRCALRWAKNMNRKSIIISSIVILVVAGLFGWQIPKKQKYDELVSSTSTPAFKVQAMNSDDDKFLDEVISS